MDGFFLKPSLAIPLWQVHINDDDDENETNSMNDTNFISEAL